MILPMMGLLFVVCAAGLLTAAILAIARPWRWCVPVALVPVLAAVGAFAFCWGLALGLERMFHSQQAGGVGFFGGYIVGGVLGGSVGTWLAYDLIGAKVRLTTHSGGRSCATRLRAAKFRR